MNLLLQNKHVPVPKIARILHDGKTMPVQYLQIVWHLLQQLHLVMQKPAWYSTCQLAVVIFTCVKKDSIWTQRVHLQHGYNCQNRCQQCWTVQPMITTKQKIPSLHFALKTTWCNTNRLATVACDCVTNVHRWAVNAFPMVIQTARIAWSIEVHRAKHKTGRFIVEFGIVTRKVQDQKFWSHDCYTTSVVQYNTKSCTFCACGSAIHAWSPHDTLPTGLQLLFEKKMCVCRRLGT